MIFNGSPFYLLFKENNLIKFDNGKIKRHVINEKVNMYTFRIKNIPCVLFDKFLTQPGFGLTNVNLKKTIPALLRAEFKNI